MGYKDTYQSNKLEANLIGNSSSSKAYALPGKGYLTMILPHGGGPHYVLYLCIICALGILTQKEIAAVRQAGGPHC